MEVAPLWGKNKLGDRLSQVGRPVGEIQIQNGLHDLLEIMIESMMVAERGEFLSEDQGNKGPRKRLFCYRR